ncbi:MAG: pyridoxal 5'-phosphate synthase glutaminase subunit PdxT [Micropruina sp.]
MTGSPTVGLVALQGGVREHRSMLESLGARVAPLRGADDLVGPDGVRVDAVLLPGGESSTIDKLLRMFDLFEPLRTSVAAGLPTLGTCAGLVLLAREVEDRAPGQQSLGVVDVTVRRNALGSQVDSAEAELNSTLGPVRVAFIRAPVVTRVGTDVEVLAQRDQQVVAVRQSLVTGIAFHPELTGETVFHRRLLSDIRG